MKKSELLKRAKEFLDYGDCLVSSPYVCCAISRAAERYLGDYWESTAKSLRTWVEEDLLDGCNVYEEWIRRNHPEIDLGNYVLIQTLRHMWLDWMITYWEEKGE